ncbi:unnamed protein product [Linum trigynum]|uniref:Uncharacterized protein n=1 Tax=Linum trigynum TaxID=586398 RepID=A0AAV2G8B7_9ROSI
MAHMPRYAKYLKGFLTKKPKFEDLANATLGEECSNFLLNRLPKKRSDPGSFTIPLSIGNYHIGNALEDLGASVNVMPYKIFKKLEVGELKTTKFSITLADRSVINPRGNMKDMLVRVGKFCYPNDFVILDISEDSDLTLILGRPFLATAKALIDVNEGTLILRDGEERITLEIEPKVRSEDVKELVSDDLNVSGGEPFKANPTITCITCGDVEQEVKEGTKTKERKKKAWRENMKQALARRKEKGKAKVVGQEGHLMERKLGGYLPRPKSVVDPLSVASRSKT